MSTFYIYSKVNGDDYGDLYSDYVDGEHIAVSTNSAEMAVAFATTLSKRFADATYEVLRYTDGQADGSVGTAIEGTFFPMIKSKGQEIDSERLLEEVK